MIILGPVQFAGVIKNCDATDLSANCQTRLPNIGADVGNLQNVLQLVFGIIAVMTVLFIIISGIRYATAIGDPAATAKLRNTIIYAVVGLVVALAAEAIVTLALGRL